MHDHVLMNSKWFETTEGIQVGKVVLKRERCNEEVWLGREMSNGKNYDDTG